jgi:MerR family copper efflux transcriptional regulator
MLISEFARAAGLTPDTVRFYVRRGLIKPETDGKGGTNPYQLFTEEHLDRARAIRMGQSLGFSLKEIGALNDEYEAAGGFSLERSAELMRSQLARLEEKAGQLNEMLAYTRAKIAWLDTGGVGPEPKFRAYEACLDKRMDAAA